MYSSTLIPQPHPDIISRRLEYEAVLVMPQKGKVKVLNDVGARVWELIDGARTIEEIVSVISQEYATGIETVSPDVNAFLAQLAEREMITFA